MFKRLPDSSFKLQATDTVPLMALRGCIKSSINPSEAEIQDAIIQGYINSGIAGLEPEVQELNAMSPT